MHFNIAALLLLAVPSIIAAPIGEAEPVVEEEVSDLVVRQLGGGPSDAAVGTSWSRTWRDSSLLVPNTFDAVRGSGCSFDITFQRDPRDTKYNLAYYSVFGEGELESQELRKPVNIGFRGSTDSTGRKQYYGKIENACSTFYDDRRAPRRLKVYFTPKSGQGNSGYISPLFY